jgi:PEP-CTERM motif
MKKILALSLLAVSIAVPSAFGQGYFTFQTGKSQAWDGFTTAGTSALSSNVKTAFLWAAGTVASPMPIASTPTSGNSNTSESYTVASAWSAILGGTFTIATNAANSQIAVQNTAANGSITYNGGVSFGVAGTSPSTTYSIFIIGWGGNYSDPFTAAANGAAVGWSTVFQQASLTSIGTGPNFSGLGANFGVFAPAVSTPEPSTMALAGLGGAAMLLFRRRK